MQNDAEYVAQLEARIHNLEMVVSMLSGSVLPEIVPPDTANALDRMRGDFEQHSRSLGGMVVERRIDLPPFLVQTDPCFIRRA